MATTSVSSQLNDLNSKKLAPRGSKAASIRIKGLVVLSGATTIDSVLVFHRIPVDAIIEDVLVTSSDHGTTGAVDIGFYPAKLSKKKDGSDLVKADAIDQDALAAAVDIKTAAITKLNVRYAPNGAKAVSTMNQRAWQLAGLSAKPTTYKEFFVAGTLSTATDAAGNIAVETIFSVE